VREAPGELRYTVELANTWYQLGHTRRFLGQHDEALAAYRQAAQAWRVAFDRAPSVPEYREKLSLGYGRLHHWLRVRGCRAEASMCLLEQKKLWPGNAERLLKISREFTELAAAVGGDPKKLTPSEQEERQRYLDLSDQVAREAAAQPPNPGGPKS
jgi:hypothetical protein